MSIYAALIWVVGLLNGVAPAVSILAVAALGFAMLQGYVPARRGAIAILGCFIVFSAGSIASALMTLGAEGSDFSAIPAGEHPIYAAASPRPIPYDPYAGASVPVRQQDAGHDLIPN